MPTRSFTVRLNDLFQRSALAGLGMSAEKDRCIENLSMLAGAGMDILHALGVVQNGSRSARMKKALERIQADVREGSTLWRALHHTGIFDEHTISLVRLGEESGSLASNLRVVQTQNEKNRLVRSRIRSAMLYPVFVFTLTCMIGLGIAWFILPKLAVVFTNLHIALPIITRVMIRVGTFIGRYGSIVIPSFIFGTILLVYVFFYLPYTRRIGQNILFLIPATHRMIQEIELTRFGYMLGTLLEAGIPVTTACELLTNETDFYFYKRFYTYLGSSLGDGNSFEHTFASYPRSQAYIPSSVQQLIVSSAHSASLKDTLLRVSANFEAKTETTTKNLTVLLEPILLVIVWAAVMLVALAVIMPIYGLVGGLRSSI